MAAEKLRDLSQPIDVALLDATLAAFYGTGSKEEKSAADLILRDLQNNPDMWLQVVHILSSTQQSNTKFFSLQVLEGVIKNRWNALPVEQRDGLKNYISEAIVKLSSDETSFHHERLYVNKLNITLVQILKHEWPAGWRSFIPDLVAAAKTSETICENYMAILKILSEEVFDFSRGEMTQLKIKELKQSLNSEFQLIHELCLYVLSASQRTDLIRATLATLHAFLCWIPLGSIFESPLLETLLKFFPVPAYRNLTLQCLTEVAPLSFGEIYNLQYVKMYSIFMMQLQGILPLSTNIPETYASGNSEEQAFIQNLALFFTSFFKSHIRVLESTQESISTLLMGLEYLINISYVDDTDVFKVCLDYWYSIVLELSEAHHSLDNPVDAASLMGLQIQMVPGVIDGLGSQLMQRPQLYAEPMSKLRLLMISRMAKPEEVLIVEDENGNIVRETMKDNDVLAQYKLMRETLVCLSHLDHNDTEKQMLRKLSKQLNGEDWTWNNLNTLCWAIGSISGSMMEEQENRFLVMVIRDLLNLCEITKGKDNKAVIASSIMYVAGQYPRFLGAHWKFLKTVVNKLFEFMHETHPGVQDMACDTFLKIVQKCKGQFVVVQLGENEPFLSELLTTLPVTITDLDPHQIHTFYESVAHTIQAEPDPQKRDEYLQRLMVLPNQRWNEIIGQARQSVDFLKDQDVIRAVLNILQTNTSVATALGTYFLSQISVIFLDMLNVYRMCSELISTTITQRGRYASERSIVKLMRSVKRETLKFIETFLDKAEDQPQIGTQFVPPMMDHVLGDYAQNSPDARESEVLSLFATIINKYKGSVMDVPRIFEAVIQCTMEMINQNFEDYPEYRLKFFSLLRAIATHCFPALIRLSSEQLKLVMDSIIRAFRHTERNIAETGLNLLLEMLKNFQVSEFCNQFYRAYFLLIEQEIFAVLKDTFYKPLFKLHVLVLEQLFCLVESGLLTEPLWDVAATVPSKYPNNGMFVREYTINLLITSFPNTTSAEVTQFVNGLFESLTDLPIFENRIRDFLVQSKARNMSVEHIDDLSDLPCEVLIEIAKRVKKIEDFVSFRCVSKSLFAAAKDEYFKGLFLRQQTPYLMLPVRDDDGDDDVREIYSLVDGGSIVASARVPNFKNKKCLESLGWLLVTEADGSMSLLEPFSGTEIPLPHQNTFEYYDSTTEDVFGFFHKMVLTSRPIETSDFVLIVILGRRRYLGYWRPGLSSFAGWQLIEFNSGVYFDVVYHGDGNFYAISYPGYVSAFNVSADAYDMGGRKVVSFMPKNVKFPTLDESLPTMLGVVQGGEAFMNVLVHRKQLYLVKTVDGSVLIITRSSPIWGLDDPTSTTTGFLVYEVDTSMGTFKEIYNLGNMAVFLGHNSTTAVDASRYKGGVIKPNHIYFTDDNWEFYHHLEHGGGMDSGVYDMETRTIEPLYPEVLCSTVSPSFWITPSPCI